MKKYILLSASLLWAQMTLVAQDKAIPVNKMGIGLDLDFSSGNTIRYADGNDVQDAPSINYSISPNFRMPLSREFAGAVGLNYGTRTETVKSDNFTEETKTVSFGPSLSIYRYCDPCWSEEDCMDFFTFLGFDFDYCSGKREYEYLFHQNNSTIRTTGSVRSISTALTAGALYRLMPNIYVQGNVNALSFMNTRTIWDNSDKNDYQRNNRVSLFRVVQVGLVGNF
jgi:hypothetical protein